MTFDAPRCMACNTALASVFCQADDAHLCIKCDLAVHSANKVSRRHVRQSIHTLPSHSAQQPQPSSAALPASSSTAAMQWSNPTAPNPNPADPFSASADDTAHALTPSSSEGVEKLKKRDKKALQNLISSPSSPTTTANTISIQPPPATTTAAASKTIPQPPHLKTAAHGSRKQKQKQHQSQQNKKREGGGEPRNDAVESRRMLEIVANACVRREAEALSESIGYVLPLSFKRRSSTASTSANGSLTDIIPTCASGSASASTLPTTSFDSEPPPPPPSPPKKPSAKSKRSDYNQSVRGGVANQKSSSSSTAAAAAATAGTSAASGATKRSRSSRPVTKKVRYECRKILAESRPRVRGRFVAKPKDNPTTTT